jgi:hypothetical protein
MSENAVRFTGAELVKRLRGAVSPKKGMSAVTKKGATLLSKLEDRELVELFIQIHIRKVGREKILERLGQILGKKVRTKKDLLSLVVGIQWFEEVTATLIEEEDLFSEEVLKKAPEVDEVKWLDRLCELQAADLKELMSDLKGAPILTKINELNQSRKLLAELVSRRADNAIKTGKRQAPDVNVKLDAGFRGMMRGADDAERSKMVKVIDLFLETFEKFGEDDGTDSDAE